MCIGFGFGRNKNAKMNIYDKNNLGRNLSKQEEYMYDLIIKGHNYYNKKDKKYKAIVMVIKTIVLLVSLGCTIILGLNGVFQLEVQVNIGLILSAVISFITGISAYFNFENYWMRNIKTHIQFNILRDGFVYEIKQTDKLSDERLEYYNKELEKIQKDNISYWQEAINKAK